MCGGQEASIDVMASQVLSANALLSTVAKQQWVGAVPTVTL